MTKQRALVGIALVVVIGGVAWWLRGSRKEDNPATSTVTQPTGAPKPHHVAAPDPARVVVTVRDAKGPVGGALVRLAPRQGDVIVLHAGADGVAQSGALDPGAWAISASAMDHEPNGVASRDLKAGETARVELVLAVGGRTLAGLVTDASGGPISGVRIDAAKLGGMARPGNAIATVLTGADGRYKLSVAEGQLLVAASHADYAPQSRYVEIGSAGATADFALVPGGVIEGIVRDDKTHQPVPGAAVLARVDRPAMLLAEVAEHRAVAGADGKFRLSGLRPGAYELVGRDHTRNSKSPTRVGLGVAEQITDVEILIGASPAIRGIVLDDSGKPAAGVLVLALGEGPSDNVTAGADGKFEVTGLPPGRYMMTAQGEDYLAEGVTPVELAQKDLDDVRISVRRGIKIKGHVERRQRCEVAGDAGERAPMDMLTMVAPVTTSDDGEFTFGPVAAGPLTLTARCESGDQGSQLVKAEPNMGEVVIAVKPGASIAGRVIDGDGKPVAGVNVMAVIQGGAEHTMIVNGVVTSGVQAVTGAGGTFEVRGLAGGGYRLSVLDRGRPMKMRTKPEAATVKLAAGEHKTGVELAVDRANGVIKGRVIDPDGKPLADAWVSVNQGLDEMLMNMAHPESPESDSRMVTVEARDEGGGVTTNELPPALTDAQGQFTITGVPSGAWTVIAEAQAGKLRGRALKVTPDATIEIQALGVTELDGTVKGASGPVALFSVELDGPTSARRSFASDTGAFSFTRVDPGNYTVKVTSSEGNGSAQVQVVAGKTASVEIALVQNAVVVGKLVDPAGQPLGGLPVTVIPDHGDGRMQVQLMGPPPTSGPDGKFRVEAKAGKSALLVLTPPRPTTKAGLVLEAGKTFDAGTITVEVKPPPAPTPRESPPQPRNSVARASL
jgi:protocatechuate 3,4-dioxygenase beta subunit